MVNWKNIHPEFTEELQKDWENKGFSYEEVEKWKKTLGQIEPFDYFFYTWLRDAKNLTSQEVNIDGKEELRKEYNALWENIHWEFRKKEYTWPNNTYQQKWEKEGFFYEEAKQLIAIGFSPSDLWKAKAWKNYDFNFQQTKEWINAGLALDEYEFAHYLQKDGYQPSDLNQNNLEELRKKCSWQDIHQNFSFKERAGWEEKKFSHQEVKKWIKKGLNFKEYEFASYLKKNYQDTFQEKNKSQIWLDWKYPQGKKEKMKELHIRGEDLHGSLKLDNFVNLEKLDCSYNQLTNLDLSNCFNLQELYCSSNRLTNLDFLNKLNTEKLVSLYIDGNNISSNLIPFNEFVDLEVLGLGNNDQIRINQGIYNSFTGSLEPLQKLIKLRHLNISNTDIDSDLEYLPESIESFYCLADKRPKAKCKNICNLFISEQGIVETDYHGKIKNFPQKLKEYKTKLRIKNQIEKILASNNFNSEQLDQKLLKDKYISDSNTWRSYLDKAWTLIELDDREKNIMTSLENLKITKELNKPSKRGWKTNLEGIDIAPFIPSKEAINLQEENHLKEPITYQKIEKSEGKTNQWKSSPQESLPIKLYNIEKDQVEWTKDNPNAQNYAILSYVWGQLGKVENAIWNTQYQDKLNPSGYKSLYKAIQTCKLLGINYLWMDQLCIDQTSTQEKNQEVPKMRQYYNNSTVTLIPVQCNLEKEDAIDTIANSEWFKRSWTFQEGWLSKHTIFMFDDKLVDGRSLATDWVLNQPGYSEYAQINVGERDNVKVATPIGWVYFKDGYNDEDKISLTLSQVLRGIKPRQRTLSIDGIYSVLGLLPYGDKVIPKYKEWGQPYTQQDLLEALYDIMKTAWENGYGEALAWHGEGYDFIPNISSLSKGSTSVVGGIVVKHKNPESNFELEAIKLNGYEYVIDDITDGLEEIESSHRGFLIDSGLCAKNVKAGDEEIKLWGTKETLEKVKVGNCLIIPSPSEWESNIPFAILAEKNDEIYQRIGLVELRGEVERLLKATEEKQLVLSMNNYKKAKRTIRKISFSAELQPEQKEQRIEELLVQNQNFQEQLAEKDKAYNELLKEIQELKNLLSIEQAKKEYWKNLYLTYKQTIENYSWYQEKTIKKAKEILNEDQQVNIHHWKNINQEFNFSLIEQWIKRDFTVEQCQDWINIGLNPQNYFLATWLRDEKHLTPEQTLNHENLENLKQEFLTYQENSQQPQILQPTTPSSNLNK
jgi:hypothetical protein